MTDEPRALPPGAEPDPGHLLPPEAWRAVVEQAERERERIERGESPETPPLAVGRFGTGLALPVDGAVSSPSNGGRRSGGPTFGVLHSAETPLAAGYAASIARYFAGGPGTSCHYMIDPAETWGVLDDGLIAWHCGNGNPRSIGVEQAGRASFTRAQWLSTDGRRQQQRVAAIMRAARDRYGIGLYWMSDAQLAAAHRGQLGGWATHDQCRRVLGGTSHTDPMPNYPLAETMQLAQQGAAPVPVPTGGDEEMLLMRNTSGTLALLTDFAVWVPDDTSVAGLRTALKTVSVSDRFFAQVVELANRDETELGRIRVAVEKLAAVPPA